MNPIKTKLVATVGPASDNEEVLSKLIDNGVNVFRLNFSHGTLQTHATALQRIRRIAGEKNAIVAVMGDLGGPKIRVGQVIGDKVELRPDQTVRFSRGPVEGNAELLSSNYPALIDDVQPGERLLIDDGNILLRADYKQDDFLVCKCEVGGTVSSHKGINLPDTDISAPALTEKDRRDLAWSIDNELDFVALSFVRKPSDLEELRNILEKQYSKIQIVSKIEKPEALQQIEKLIELSDVVLVARGDLGVEMDVARVPLIQKEIALHCRRLGKPVIIATQMLQSMVNSQVATRAEVSDVANAILDYADAVMLSAETAIGKYPVSAVKTMRSIASRTESFKHRYYAEPEPNLQTSFPVATAMAHGGTQVATRLEAPLIAVWTVQGDAPRLLSKHRGKPPIIALAQDEKVCRQMSIFYGVIPDRLEQARDIEQMLQELDEVLLEKQWARQGDRIVVLGDIRPDIPGEIDMMLVHLVAR